MTDWIEAAAKAQAVSDYEANIKRPVKDPEALWDSMLPEEQNDYRTAVTAALEAASTVMLAGLTPAIREALVAAFAEATDRLLDVGDPYLPDLCMEHISPVLADYLKEA